MTTNTNTNTNESGGGGGGGFGSKIKGAAQVIHGLGENLRGTALGTADRATSSVAGIQKDADVAAKGRAEVAEGMARLKGHPPGTVPAGTTPADKGTGAGTGTGTGAATAVGAGAGVTGQGQQQGTEHEKSSAAGGKSGPETTGLGAGHEAASGAGEQTSAGTGTRTATGTGATATPAVGTGVTGQGQQGTEYEKTGAAGGKSVPETTGLTAAQTGLAAAGTGEQKQQDPIAGSQQEGKRDDRDVQERSRSGDPGQTQTENRPQQTSELSSQQRVDEQPKAGQMGAQQKNVQQGGWVAPGGKPCIHFQGISMDEGEEQAAEKACEAGQNHHEGVRQESGQGQIRFQDFQGAGI